MIYDKLENIGRYKGISDDLDFAIEYLKNDTFRELNLGTHIIAPDKLNVLIRDYTTREFNPEMNETHDIFLDLHYCISGTEYAYITVKEKGTLLSSNPLGDIAFYEVEKGEMLEVKLGDDNFLLVFPGELQQAETHRDGEEPQKVEKMVLKIRGI